jgi:hypothetical protein
MAEVKRVISCRVWRTENQEYVTYELSMNGITKYIIVIEMTKQAEKFLKTT